MKRILVALVAVSTTLLAQGYGGLELLYWKATHCPIPFALRVREAAPGQIRARDYLIKGDYGWGGRGYVGYQHCCHVGQLSYLWWSADNASKRVRPAPNDISFTLQGSEGEDTDFAKSRLYLRYQNVDCRFGEVLQQGRDCSFAFLGHLRWARIDMHNRTIGTGANAPQSYEQDSSFQGGGIGIGLRGSGVLWRGLSLGGRLSCLGLIGRVSLDHQEILFPGANTWFILAPSRRTTLVPVGEARLNIGYFIACRCMTVAAEMGYELDYYFKALRYSNQPRTGGRLLPLRTCFDVGFGGPYVGLRVGF